MSKSNNFQTKKEEKIEVASYFNGMGFDRWRRIYSDRNDINIVQKNIRIGHQKTVDDVISWIKDSGQIATKTFCDAGCGVGSLTIPLSGLGPKFIQASDISKEMIQETKLRFKKESLGMSNVKFQVSDLEAVSGKFNTVICLDVFIHYPQKIAEEMVIHLCNLSEDTLIVSFAPYTPFLSILKRIGQLFPGPSKTTRAYTLKERGIIAAANLSGFKVVKSKLNQAPFYFSKLIEFVKI